MLTTLILMCTLSGLAIGAGFQPVVVLAILALADRGGLIHLSQPFSLLGSSQALVALVLLGGLGLLSPKPGLTHLLNLTRLPLALLAGALGAVAVLHPTGQGDPSLALAVGAALAGGVHSVVHGIGKLSATFASLAGLKDFSTSVLQTPLNAASAAFAATLALSALFAPLLVPPVLVLAITGVVFLAGVAARGLRFVLDVSSPWLSSLLAALLGLPAARLPRDHHRNTGRDAAVESDGSHLEPWLDEVMLGPTSLTSESDSWLDGMV